MANVSSSNGIEKYPKLRFPEFSDGYYESTLGEIFEYERPDNYIVISEKYSDAYPIPVLTANQAFVLGYTSETSGIYDKGPVILFDDFTCDMKYADFPFKVKSSAMKLLTSKKEIPIFYAYNLLQHINYKPEGHARHWISIMQPLKVLLPCYAEQERIGEFLSLVCKKIEKHQLLIDALKKYKRGVSKKLFDEIHNDSSCVIKQFSEVFEPLQNNTFSRECLTNDPSDVLNIHYGDILVKYGSVVDIDIDEVPYIKPETDISKYNSSSYLQNGDVVFADTAEDYTVGKTCEITNASGHRVLSGLHTMPYRSTINFVPMYLGYYFNSAAFRAQILPMIQGAKVSSISKSEMKKTTLHIPAIESQMKVVNILYTLDERIKRTELVLQELQQIKKGLLQNLFI